MLDRESSPSKPEIGIAADLFPARQIFRRCADPPYPRTAALVIFPKRVNCFTLPRAPRDLTCPKVDRKEPNRWGCINGASGSRWLAGSKPRPRHLLGTKHGSASRARRRKQCGVRRLCVHGRPVADSAPSFDHAASERTATAARDGRWGGKCSRCRRRSAETLSHGDLGKRQLGGRPRRGGHDANSAI